MMSENRKNPFDDHEQHPNVIGASARPVYDKTGFVQTIKEVMPVSNLLLDMRREFAEGEVILTEGDTNSYLYIILDGQVSQNKENEGITTQIGLHTPGDFIGLLSFQTGETVFTTAKAHTNVVTLCLDHHSFEVFMNEYPQISRTLQGLIFTNLADRYRSVVMLHVEVASLTHQLEEERNQLERAIRELERTRNALISQEKMATLGEMTAGLAHEINNPASALLRSVDFLTVNLPAMAERASALPDTGLLRLFFETGMKRDFLDTNTHRIRMKELGVAFPGVPRTRLRAMAELDDNLLFKLTPLLQDDSSHPMLELLLDAYQSGVFLNNIRLSTARIEYLVRSLKSYSRQVGKSPENVDIREGIRETLQIMGNRLRDIKLVTRMTEPAIVNCFVGEINQVWTNIVINACDAMGNKGTLIISTEPLPERGVVKVTFADNGPGVPDEIKQRIFDASFSTKTAGGDFGLGLGLAISRSIIEKHHGTIEVRDRPCHGAEFIITLPLD